MFLAGVLQPDVAGAASADPLGDQYAHGLLGFCDRAGQSVTSGSLLSVPFVWSAVSSTPAPKGYIGAYLAVYQPIQYVDASNWSGYQLTGVATFSNATHPMAQATNVDAPLLWAVQQFPPHWDGLMEVRMIYVSPNRTAYNTSYPAAVLRISGNSWSVVDPAATDCKAGRAVAEEAVEDPQSEIVTPQSLTFTSAGGGSGASHGSQAVSGGGATGASARSGSSGTEIRRVAAGTGQTLSGSVPTAKTDAPTGWLVTGVATAAAIAGGAGVFVVRRRNSRRS